MYSQARQDDFVLHLIDKPGTYLEIGASHPISINNTYALEQRGWGGLSLDIEASNLSAWNEHRRNPLIIADAITYKYEAKHYDYLQLDIDPPENTYKALQRVFECGVTFSVLTYETDAYSDSRFVEPSRELITSKGYILAFKDIMCPFGAFEDWYINPKTININKLKTWIP
jgi:hypothetical protein